MNFSDYHIITINGFRLDGREIVEYCGKSEQTNIKRMGNFIAEWLTENPVMKIKTSGSTGTPKIISVEKNQMLQSASMTAAFFGFGPGQTALLCLPMGYIAGKMMVVRALFSQLNLICIEPDKAPLASLSPDLEIDFAPLVPMQLKDVKSTGSVHTILLGGASLSGDMEAGLQSLEAEIYHGYGMTETLSHVAVRRVNGSRRSEIYHALEGIAFEVDSRSCLCIRAPFLKQPIQTNDVVDLKNEKEFIWKGRIDFVVNSGGIKLFPEEIEKKLSSLIPEKFFVAGLPDDRLGQKLCLYIEGESYSEEKLQSFRRSIEGHLDKYEKPQEIFFMKKFKTTESGKIKREETIQIRGYKDDRDTDKNKIS